MAKRFKSNGTAFIAPGAKKGLAGNSTSTINKTTSALIQIIDMAVSRGLAADNVVKQNIQLEKLHVCEEAKLSDIPSKEDFNRILEHLTSTDVGKPFAFGMKLLAYSGCRIDESRSLKWKHVDFEMDRIHIPGTKTRSSDRLTPMTPDLAALLNQAHERAYKIAGDDTSEQKVMPVHCLNNRLRAACKRQNDKSPRAAPVNLPNAAFVGTNGHSTARKLQETQSNASFSHLPKPNDVTILPQTSVTLNCISYQKNDLN